MATITRQYVHQGAARDDLAGQDHNTSGDAVPAVAMLSVIDLLLAASDGDPIAWEEIVRRYSKIVFSKVHSFRLQDADAHDAIQATWLRLAENWHSVHHPERLGGWLATVACRECLRILRQAKRAPAPLDPTDIETDNVPDPAEGPEQQVIDADTAQAVRNLVAELPPRRRILLRELFTDNPRPYTEISHITGVPVGSIGPTRARALEQLRRTADERGLRQAG